MVESRLDRLQQESHRDVFDRLVEGKNAEETLVNVQSLINFVDLLGSNADAWEQLTAITRVEFQGLNPKTKQMQSSVIAFKVSDKQEFLKALRAMGYHVNNLIEKARIRMGIVRINFKTYLKALTRRAPFVKRLPSHAYDNARQRTRSIRDPQLHIYNEQGDDNFQAHWDIGSSNTGVPVVDPIGGFWHGYFASPQEVARHLRRL